MTEIIIIILEMRGLPSLTPHPRRPQHQDHGACFSGVVFSLPFFLELRSIWKERLGGGLCAGALGCCPPSATGLGNITLALLATDPGLERWRGFRLRTSESPQLLRSNFP